MYDALSLEHFRQLAISGGAQEAAGVANLVLEQLGSKITHRLDELRGRVEQLTVLIQLEDGGRQTDELLPELLRVDLIALFSHPLAPSL